jgi:hypothetical protein
MNCPRCGSSLRVLRARREVAQQAAQDMIVSDHHVARGELLVLEQIRDLLYG